MAYTLAEEDYLKAIYKVSERHGNPVSTSAVANEMGTSAASVTDMVKKLADKDLIHYERYKGVSLSKKGARLATQLIRKHRLWETFLVDKLQFTWDEVHLLAEQLEHIQSDELVDRLDQFLGQPRYDPHGDPIPDASGAYRVRAQAPLSQAEVGTRVTIVGVRDHDPAFLRFLDKTGLTLGVAVAIAERFSFDGSLLLRMDDGRTCTISAKASQSIFVQ
jgi:DtxR family Mn-dependent transcriptional regulator